MAEQRIKELRVRLGLSQERFARVLDVSLQSVRRWEAGVSRPLPLISVRLEELRREMEAREREKGGVPMGERRKRQEDVINVEVGLGGLGGLFKGLGGLFDLVNKMAEEGKNEETRSGEKEVLGGRGKAVYGFSVRVGLGGKPVIESFGNLRATESGTVVAETREPLVDVFDEEGEVRVIAEIPGVDEDSIKVEIKDDILTLSAEARDRKYHKEVLLPAPVNPQPLGKSYRNGVLELKLKKGSS